MSLLLYRVFSRALIVFFAFLPLFISPAYAATGAKADAYLVQGVQVDVQGTSALDARDKAYIAARRAAWQQLTQRLAAKTAATMAVPDDKTLASAVKDFSIKNEKMTSRRYAATVDIRFTPAAAKRVLEAARAGEVAVQDEDTDVLITGNDDNAAPVARRASDEYVHSPAARIPASAPVGATLILPWYDADGRNTLWGQANPWRAAWEEKSGLNRDRSLILPVGDTDDMRIYSPQQPLSYGGNIDALMERYRTDTAILAMAQPQANGSVAVSLYRYSGGNAVPVGRFGIDATSRDVLGDAVIKAAATLKALPKQVGIPAPVQVSVAPGSVSVPQDAAPEGGVYRTLARFSGLQEWVAMRQALSRVPGMGQVSVHSISPSQANIEFDYKGDPVALMHAFSQSGLQIAALTPGTVIASGPGDVPPQFILSMGRAF